MNVLSRSFLIIVLLLFTLNSWAQDTLIIATDTLDVIVYSGKFPEHSKRIAQTIKVIRDKPTLNFQPNTADVLINSGSLFVQKSQQGGGSPVIRGFEASRIVLMVDGIRMNNAIYRAGHLQNAITIDNSILDRIEIIYGPSSTLYGSDALGGAINLYTRDPKLSPTGKTQVNSNAILRYATAIEEAKAHVDVNIGGKKWASFTSVTYGSFGDITQGKQRNNKYASFGLKSFIVRRVGDTDSAFVNPYPNRQSPSGYNQWDIAQKILYQPRANIQHILNLQFSNSTDIPRYDRLTEVSGESPVFAEWYYGPQVRNVAAYHFNASQLSGFFREVKVNANFQDIEESRINRRFRNNNKSYNWERVNVFGLNIDAKRYSGKHELHFGAESYTNYVRSTADRRNIVSGTVSKIQTRYSDGPTKMSFNAVYAQHTLKFSDHWTLNDGLRLNHVNLNAIFVDTSILHLPFTSAKQNNLALTGNIGLIYSTPSQFKLAILLSSGFRAPNVDDLTKVFDTRVGAVVVPNTDVKPEYTYNTEINFNMQHVKFSYGAAVFYTMFRNVLVVDKTTFNGQDSIMFQGVKSAVFSTQNKAKAHLYGFSANAAITVLDKTTLDGVVTYTYGQYRTNAIEVPLDHVPPMYGRIALKHTRSKWQGEVYGLFNGWKRIEDYSPSGEDNPQYATPEGMPAWFTLNAKIILSLSKHFQTQLLAENILDRNYRYFASGISAPGRNFVLSLRASF
jgi:hemoglobin/transferrin/lactoferrin receptor protein